MRRALPLLAFAILGFACDGTADDPFRDSDEGHVDPAAQTTDGLTSSAPMVRNLSNREYLTAISDLIGLPLATDLQKAWTPTTQFGGFDSVAWTNFDAKALRDRAETMETILDRAVTSPKVMTCSVTAMDGLGYGSCAKNILEPMATRAYGRPLAAEELAGLNTTYDAAIALAKGSLTDPAAVFKDGVRAGLGSIFLAPQFLTRSESPPNPEFVGERDLNAYELASRVSFMFLNSVPDDQLWLRAQEGSLMMPDVLAAEVNRIIDEKPERFVQNFMGQWFDFRAYDETAPTSIERAMWNESWRVFADLIKTDMPIAAILQPGFTYVNQQLATHYGMQGQFTADFQKVPVTDRGGVLQQGSWLSLSATALKTSPIHRGRLVQDRLLCKAIPPPDQALFARIQAVSAGIPATASVKERLQQHRTAGEACMGCHQYMDPIGLGLESYDQFGKLRTMYADKKPVEAASDILGKPFATVGELSQIVTTLPEYSHCVSEKMVVFALRSSSPPPALLDAISQPTDKAPGLREMILRLVTSKAFRRVNHTNQVNQEVPQ
jgi:hypothetical protein